VLYLSDSEQGARLEVKAERICVQEYVIHAPPLRLANLSSQDVPNLLQAAFDLAEKALTPGWPQSTTYAFPQLLARIVCHHGFDGFIVPGVRGNVGLHYRNVVLFRPEERWQAWSKGPTGFSP
jgi:hypothetical protein